MPSHQVHMARLRQQLERAVELSRQAEAEDDRVAALLLQQRDAISEAVTRFRHQRGRDLRVLALDQDRLLCDLYQAVAGAFGIGCDVAADQAGVRKTRHDAEHALIVADPRLQDAMVEALAEEPRPMLVMTPDVAEVALTLQSPFMERSLGMLVKPFELEPLAFIISHWTFIRLIGDEAPGSVTVH
ncbi:MAG TPA: hypothetical protein VGR02_22060 [Thermoanaerobaculia bacterium]|jgi:hypothetical protein|nr:hypothetical protein [Thermoanaerobaculia bacterium]